ncbi:uncharacterized protein LOC143296118 [Babylonia areolata]|uniref:uncharacterized protein LOC143296118 n=1 Tax=Babylonia areolata TaxID=304850 RepID=UPI003FD6B940
MYKPSVIGITEVKPKNTRYAVQECEVAIDDYDLFHNRTDKKGRGMCLHVDSSLKASQIEVQDNDFEEQILVECRLDGSDKLLIGLIYRSPNSPPENTEKLNKLIVDLGKQKQYSHILPMGDFNHPKVDWQNETCNCSEEHQAQKFLKATQDAYLTQHQKEPTRFRQGQNPSLDDLVFTNREKMINSITTQARLGRSDHVTLIISFSCSYDKREPARKKTKFEEGNYEEMNLDLAEADWDELLSNKSVEETWKTIKDEIQKAGKSCVTNLLEALDDWTRLIDSGSSIDVVYMDFQKAFDTVPHCRLLKKVEAYGLKGPILNWISAFLGDRKQRVRINGTFSDEVAVTSGIPQGSVLGPILFVIYTNDLPKHVQNTVKLFADDTKIYAASDNQESTASLQQDLGSLQKWSNDWLLKFHPQKCKVMKIGTRKSKALYHMKHVDAETGTIREIPLAESEVEADLGVQIDNYLKFKKQHVDSVTARANSVIGIIRRTFEFLDCKLFIQLYKTIETPILEYAQTVRQPRHKTLCKQLEDVQRRATKLISSISELPYSERLERLGLPSLEHRRLRGDMIDIFNQRNPEPPNKKITVPPKVGIEPTRSMGAGDAVNKGRE